MPKITNELLETAKELQHYYENNIGVGDIEHCLAFCDSAKDLIDAILYLNEGE